MSGRQVLVDEQLLLRLIGHTQARGEIGTAQHDAETALELCRTQPQPSSSSGEVARILTLLSDWVAAEIWFEGFDRAAELAEQLQEYHPAHLRTLAQAQAGQQARLRGLVGTWRGHIAWLEDEGDTGERHQAFTECADELEAVLGGKE